MPSQSEPGYVIFERPCGGIRSLIHTDDLAHVKALLGERYGPPRARLRSLGVLLSGQSRSQHVGGWRAADGAGG